jgi:hypothetical protein
MLFCSNGLYATHIPITHIMRDWYHNYGHLTHIDATYCVIVENFLLFHSLCQNENLNGVPVAYCFMRSETKENLEFYYEKLNSEVSKNGQIVMVDKDLSNISLISQFFVNVIVLICSFHVAKYFKTQIRKDEMEVPNNKKSLLYDILSKCIYTNDLSKYEDYKNQIKEISINFYDYFIKIGITAKKCGYIIIEPNYQYALLIRTITLRVLTEN